MSEAEQNLLKIWQRLSRLPAGAYLFSLFIKWKVPYSGTIPARVIELTSGYARLCMNDRKRIRNHLKSIHAIALANLGELTSGLALNACLPANIRGIVLQVNTEYLKKSRGKLTCESRVNLPVVDAEINTIVEAHIKDSEGETVAKTQVSWLLSPKE